MNWLTFALAAVAINTTLGLGLRTISKESANPRLTGFIYNCCAAVASLFLWVLSGAQLPHNLPLTVILLTLLSALGYGIFQRGQFYLRKHVEVSSLTPIMQTGIIAGFAASIIILGEPLTPKKIAGASIILAATLIITFDKKLKVSKYALVAVAIAAALSIAGVIDKLANPHYPILFYASLIWILPLPFIAYPTTRQDLKTALMATRWPIPVLASLNAMSLLFLQRALQLGEASKVIPVLSTTTIVTVLGGVIILGETKDWPRKLLAGLLATIGILIIR